MEQSSRTIRHSQRSAAAAVNWCRAGGTSRRRQGAPYTRCRFTGVASNTICNIDGSPVTVGHETRRRAPVGTD